MNKLWMALLLLCIAACTQTKDIIGIGEKESLDEFSVLQAPKLELPPHYNLRPPVEGKTSVKKTPTDTASEGENTLLKQMDNALETDVEHTEADKEFLDKM